MNEFKQGLLTYLTNTQLSKIEGVKIGIAGVGGLGSNAAVNLARSGFCRFVAVDFDVVEASNLNRQFYFLDQIGEYKAEALKKNLLKINSQIEVCPKINRITRENVCCLFAGCDILIEAVDSPKVKPIIAEAAAKLNIFCVCASGIAGFGNTDGISVKKINDMLYIVGDMKTQANKNNPPLSPKVAIAAAKQADLVLEYVLKKY
ncbi:MAG: sulfur carrier protein ThiS adenylyltransferase ThiF [Clostridia bacterium]|nr:sulfur carrier protein ThiS adenylyltransferase ThiF [Clostridia bacterium]